EPFPIRFRSSFIAGLRAFAANLKSHLGEHLGELLPVRERPAQLLAIPFECGAELPGLLADLFRESIGLAQDLLTKFAMSLFILGFKLQNALFARLRLLAQFNAERFKRLVSFLLFGPHFIGEGAQFPLYKSLE